MGIKKATEMFGCFSLHLMVDANNQKSLVSAVERFSSLQFPLSDVSGAEIRIKGLEFLGVQCVCVSLVYFFNQTELSFCS